ncbi:hypothetical protein O3M35_010845 [Rhynocoris fuscipes]|uniref:Putative inorganic phosphate cotransporter n=1 Tax=Rhynocoris fuscipes TaxID=488301 RepID=A0AAW1D0Q6_9HEMI
MDLNTSKLELTKPQPSHDDIHFKSKFGSFGKRHIQAGLLFLCLFTIFFLRVNMSVAIVSMTDKNSSNVNFHEFKWSEREKSAILSSFFWGYLVIQTPAGQLGQKFSPKLLLLVTNLISAFLAALIPTASYSGGWKLLCAIRAAQGLCQGFVVPLSYNLASKWAPLSERNRFVGLAMNGGTLGATLALPLCGLLAQSSGGWPSVFYFSACLGLCWTLLWAWLGADSPATHTTISLKEREYIESSLSHTTSTKVYKTPWKAILTSVPFWALIAAHLGNGWGFSILITETPSFINSVLNFDIGANGFLSALPFLCMWLFAFPVCWLADYLQKNNIVSNNFVRKFWTTISQGGSAIALITLGYIGYDAVAAMVTLTIAVTVSAFLFSGFNINHLDLSPNFVGVLMGIANGLENVSTIIAPLTVGLFVQNPDSLEEWRSVFMLTACVALTGNAIFVIFGSTNVQPWNIPDYEDDLEQHHQQQAKKQRNNNNFKI